MKGVVAASMLLLASSVMAISDTEKTAVIERCKDQMNQYGATMIKTCSDQNIEARQAILNNQDKYAKHMTIVESCAERMGKIGGWVMIKACTDQDVEAEQALSQ